LTVLPAFERRGIGKRLIEEGLKRLGNRAPVVVSSSQKGEKVYERCGFVKLGENRHSSKDSEASDIPLICPFMVYYPDKSQ
jgi:ribosomal protein S18 acetylase RimI-like enzyme